MVVIKGIGIISPLGSGKTENLAKMREGRTSIKKVSITCGDWLMAKVEDFFPPRDLVSMPNQLGYDTT